MEIWNAYDIHKNKQDFTLVRGEKIPEGYYHLVVQILVRHIDGSFLLMQRDFNKAVFAGVYEASAGGSVLLHETALDGAKRELYEETGISSYENFEYLSESVFGHSIFMAYLCTVDLNKDAIRYQEEETINHKWISTDDFMSYCESESVIPNQVTLYQDYLKTLKKA